MLIQVVQLVWEWDYGWRFFHPIFPVLLQAGDRLWWQVAGVEVVVVVVTAVVGVVVLLLLEELPNNHLGCEKKPCK